MRAMDAGRRIEVVRGRLDEGAEAAVRAFWGEKGSLPEEVATERLPQVVCVLREPGGEVAGVNSAYAHAVGLIGGRTFWVYRSLLASDLGDEDWQLMLVACYEEMAAEFERGGEADAPIGVLAPVSDTAMLERRPEAIWPESGFAYAGFLRDGRQARIRYFPEGRV
jgi:hypothetical protein